jgi:hypothetical protein
VSVQAGGARVGVAKAAKDGCGDDSSFGFAILCREALVESTRYALLNALMGSRMVVIPFVLLDDAMQLAAI